MGQSVRTLLAIGIIVVASVIAARYAGSLYEHPRFGPGHGAIGPQTTIRANPAAACAHERTALASTPDSLAASSALANCLNKSVHASAAPASYSIPLSR
jgi:hypothetical protein